ncbi:hypothetical protein LGM46_29295 [Burkholderia arboris]|uniref:hypothetical protein n=1 Tax=Burkholderia arboris TaxID=488730 RepID=UPI001CF2828B|nr:hypothetical protein [Burkholderia arboris]MCA8037068.1 hypothetical protein [Burkholderia arboris]
MSFLVVVMANDDEHARTVAQASSDEAIRDSGVAAGTSRLITDVAQLRDGWSGDCLPYGGDGRTKLADIIAAAAAPERCARTMDMFGDGT